MSSRASTGASRASKATKSEPKLTANGKRVGRPPKSEAEKAASAAAKKEKQAAYREGQRTAAKQSIHEQSAAWRASHPNAPRELGPTARAKPLPGTEGARFNPFQSEAEAVHNAVRVYGEHQLGNVLQGYSQPYLRDAAKQLGVQASNKKADTLSRIVSHVTNGHYSANFSAPSGSRRASASTASTPSAGSARGGAQRTTLQATGTTNPAYMTPGAATNVYAMRQLYGDSQLGAAIDRYPLSELRSTARNVANFTGSRPPSLSGKASIRDWLVQQARTGNTDTNAAGFHSRYRSAPARNS